MVASNPQHSSPCKFITPVSVSFFTWCLPRVSVFLCPNSPLPVRTAILDLGLSLLRCDLTLVTSAIQIRSHSEVLGVRTAYNTCHGAYHGPDIDMSWCTIIHLTLKATNMMSVLLSPSYRTENCDSKECMESQNQDCWWGQDSDPGSWLVLWHKKRGTWLCIACKGENKQTESSAIFGLGFWGNGDVSSS